MLAAVLAEEKFSKEALTDTLKFTFNLLLHYPRMLAADPRPKEKVKGKGKEEDAQKIMGEQWDERFDPYVLFSYMADTWPYHPIVLIAYLFP